MQKAAAKQKLEDMVQGDRAIADCSEAIRLNPKWRPPSTAAATFTTKKGDFDRAIADYSEAMRLDPKRDHALGRGEWASSAAQATFRRCINISHVGSLAAAMACPNSSETDLCRGVRVSAVLAFDMSKRAPA
jgi:tetratricopeptide (TPR) repeat protein